MRSHHAPTVSPCDRGAASCLPATGRGRVDVTTAQLDLSLLLDAGLLAADLALHPLGLLHRALANRDLTGDVGFLLGDDALLPYGHADLLRPWPLADAVLRWPRLHLPLFHVDLLVRNRHVQRLPFGHHLGADLDLASLDRVL